MKHLKLYFLVFFIMLVLFACEEKTTNPEEQPSIISPIVHLISVEDINQNILTYSESSLLVKSTGDLTYLAAGDIIIAGPNDYSDRGFFLKIISKLITNEAITLTTEKASLTEAFTNLNLDKKIKLTPEDIQNIELNSSIYTNANDKFIFNLDCIMYDRDNDFVTIDDQVKLSGNLDFELALDLALIIENQQLVKHKISCELDKNINLTLVSGNTFYENLNNLASEIALINYSPQLIFLENIPLVITPQLQLSLGLDGKLMFDFASDINYSESSESGLEYESGLWNSISSSDNVFTPSPLSENNDLDFTQQLVTDLSLSLFNSDLASISVANNLAFKTKYYNTQENSNIVIKNITATQQVISDLKMNIISSLLTDKHSEVLAYEEIIADYHSTIDIPDDMAYVPGGTFIMGNTRGAEVEEELTPHEVFISPFYMCIHEVTQSEYSAIMGQNPSQFVGEECPVEKVSRPKAFAYCNLLSIAENREPCYTYNQDGTDPDDWYPGWTANNHTDLFTCDFTANGYRLPTEAEWEYAARGATNEPDYIYSGSDIYENVAPIGIWTYWSEHGMEGYDFHRYNNVCSKNANTLGIYDMTGGVWEMCWDYYAPYSTEFQINPTGPESGTYRISRGGAIDGISIENQYHCQVIDREQQLENDMPTEFYGFRVVFNASQEDIGGNHE